MGVPVGWVTIDERVEVVVVLLLLLRRYANLWHGREMKVLRWGEGCITMRLQQAQRAEMTKFNFLSFRRDELLTPGTLGEGKRRKRGNSTEQTRSF